jgi:hypothetical protein
MRVELAARDERSLQRLVTSGSSAFLAGECLADIAAQIPRQVKDQILNQFIPASGDRGDVWIGLAKGVEAGSIAHGGPAGTHVIELDDTRSGVREVTDELAEDVGLIRVAHATELPVGPQLR